MRKEKERERQERLEYDRGKALVLAQEDRDLRNYMISIASEKWAKDNVRLQRYIRSLDRPKPLRPRNGPDNTKERLGFVPGGYTDSDFVRTTVR